MSEHQVVYQAVVARRLQWDSLLWQVPTLSLTAQAFLFTIALGPDSSRMARTLAAVLSIVISCLSVTLMARHRQAELSDAAWLERFEGGLPEEMRVHGKNFINRRAVVHPRDRMFVPLVPGYKTWTIGLLLFALVAMFAILLTWLDPSPLSGTQ
ncbi:hypothetical protein ACFRJ9_15460 [Paenarthrobacter sp. NPDC056912]|uniref:hypothetical protein n=1 Tax=Paenarthrobacter sp. NPDC056912 TaxID=3345965 RepID=UPI00366DB677